METLFSYLKRCFDMTAERLNEIMAEQYSYITYDTELAKEYLECGAPQADEDTIAWCFADYLLSQDLAEEVVE
jgi:hypothetical protein